MLVRKRKCRRGLGARAVLVLAALGCGCGLTGGDAGGASNLPAAPLSPWTPIGERDPCDRIVGSVVLQLPATSTVDPWAVAADDQVWLYYATGAATRTVIARVPSSDGIHFSVQQSRAVLEPEQLWEGRSVRGATVIEKSGGWRMYYLAGVGAAIGTATSTDGLHWTRGEQPVLRAKLAWEHSGDATALGRPSAARIGDAIYLWYGAGYGRALGLARSTDGVHFERVDGDPRTAKVDPVLASSGEQRLTTPYVETAIEATGRRIYRLWVARGTATASEGIAVYGSFDGTSWKPHDKLAVDDAARQPTAPARLDRDGQQLMYAARLVKPKQARRGIALYSWGVPAKRSCDH